MLLLTLISWAVTRRQSAGEEISHWQNTLETIVEFVGKQIAEITQQTPEPYLPFIGTLFLLIAVSNTLSVVPGFQPPTASLSTTTALALCVLFAVPIFGIADRGVLGYLRRYLHPTPFMLPFNIIGEISRTIALAVRLYGNVMSGAMIAAILLAVIPFFFPVAMQLLGLLTGFVQAYIFAVLAMVYIGSTTRSRSTPRQTLPATTD
jgi:F-type H+-transporting ATPase subunit a